MKRKIPSNTEKRNKKGSHYDEKLTSSSAVKIIPRACSCTSFFLKSFNLSATERPANFNGCTTTASISAGGRFVHTSSTKFFVVRTSFCCFSAKARCHLWAVSIEMHQGSTPMAASFGKFW